MMNKLNVFKMYRVHIKYYSGACEVYITIYSYNTLARLQNNRREFIIYHFLLKTHLLLEL